MSEEIKNGSVNENEVKEGFFKRYTGPDHPLLSIIVFNAAAVLLILLTLFIDSGIILPLLYAACLLIPMAYVRPMGIIGIVKSVLCALVIGGLVAAANAGALAMYAANIPVVSVAVVILIWAAVHIIYFAAGAFAYKISFKTLNLPAIILFLGSILTEIIFEIGAVIILSGSGLTVSGGSLADYLGLLNAASGSRAFDIAFLAIRMLLVSLSVCVAANHARKLKSKD